MNIIYVILVHIGNFIDVNFKHTGAYPKFTMCMFYLPTKKKFY